MCLPWPKKSLCRIGADRPGFGADVTSEGPHQPTFISKVAGTPCNCITSPGFEHSEAKMFERTRSLETRFLMSISPAQEASCHEPDWSPSAIAA